VVKAYTTRVGNGPLPTEAEAEASERLRTLGGEFGATTGRPRRCGWLDLVALRHAAAFDAPTGLAVTKLDVLSGSEEIKLCRAYRLGGRETTRFPLAAEDLAECQPVYETVPGWREDLSGMREYDELPKEARSYLARIAEGVGAPIAYVSLGPSAEETIATGFDSE
jgi:adenylosuccinate synthase